jgi:predicted ATPase
LQDRRLELLVNGAQDLPPHQRSLHNAIAHSYDLLDEGERRLFRSLGVFAGGCDLEAIEAVGGWDQEGVDRPLLQTLHALVGKSLVRAEPAPRRAERYLLLETIREFALNWPGPICAGATSPPTCSSSARGMPVCAGRRGWPG